MLFFCWDNCGGQNKNQFIAQVMIYNANKTNIDKIHSHFLYKEHTFLADVINFSNIENNLKQKKLLYTTDDYVHVISKTNSYKKDKKYKKMKNNCSQDDSTGTSKLPH